MWDVGGQSKIRPLWKYYYQNTDALIFVVDSCDRERLKEVSNFICFPFFIQLKPCPTQAKEELDALVSSDELRNAQVLVLANKADMPNALSTSDLSQKLGLTSLKNNWFIQSTCAVTGEGLYEGLDWLSAELKKPQPVQRLY